MAPWTPHLPPVFRSRTSRLSPRNRTAKCWLRLPPLLDDVYAIEVLPDGKLLVAGQFSFVNGVQRRRIARLNADGSLDTNFLASGEGTGNDVESMALQPDGKILLGGPFGLFGTNSRAGIVRLLENGEFDPSFDPQPGAGSTVLAVAAQGNGGVLVGGNFRTFQGVPRDALVRLHSNGRLDTSFVPPLIHYHTVYAIAVLPDDKIIVGGHASGPGASSFGTFLRLHPNGALDTSFAEAGGIGLERRGNDQGRPFVMRLALHTSGRIYIGGYFTHFNGFARPGVARIHGNPELTDLEYDDGVFSANLLTDPERVYDFQRAFPGTNDFGTNWSTRSTIAGDGSEWHLMDTNSNAGTGFYRVRASSHP
jgi:uncharacterized delta-60 repeat protein